MIDVSVKVLSVLFIINYVNIPLVASYGVPIESVGLYNSSEDKVLEYISENFIKSVYRQPHATLVEFYNTYCGYCRAFAPIYIELANDVARWNNAVQIAAVDCTAEVNFKLCPEFNVTSYPSMRYFHPNLEYDAKNLNLGIPVQKTNFTVHRNQLIDFIKGGYPNGNYPNLQVDNKTTRAGDHVFDNVPDNVEYVFVITLPNGNHDGNMVHLDLQGINSIGFKHVMNDKESSVIYYDRKLNKYPLELNEFTRDTIRAKIIDQLQTRKIEIPDWVLNNDYEHRSYYVMNGTSPEERRLLIEYVKSQPFTVYKSDIEAGLRYVLFNEIGLKSQLSEEMKEAVKNFVFVTKQYAGMDDKKIQKFLDDLYNWMTTTNTTLTGFQINKYVRIYDTNDSVFSRNRLIGCAGSKPSLRGYTCGLWQLFHHMTVRAAASPKSDDGGQVLKAIHGYMKYFFGCTGCSEHFQKMAKEEGLFDVVDFKQAVLWLWGAHNKVNSRLSKDITDDPLFPKEQFPSQSVCKECSYKKDDEIYWNLQNVQDFLHKQYYNPNGITIAELDRAIDGTLQ